MADSEEDPVQGEIGVNYDRPVGRWDVSLIGLINREEQTVDDITIRRNAAETVVRNTTQNRTREVSETILRGTVDTAFASQAIQIGAESALNTLKQEQLRLLVEDIGRRATTDDIRYFDPDRTDMESGFESRYLERASAPWILLELSGQF